MVNILRIIWSKCFSFVIVFIILINLEINLAAQSNFIPLERGDHSERKERLTFSPGLEFSGSFRFRTSKVHSTSSMQSRSDTNSPEEFSLDQDLRLHFRTNLHRTISINLEIATNQEPYYKSDIRTSKTSRHSELDSQLSNIYARQSYLEINRNPSEETKLGKQIINIGDRRGKVFYGILSGLTQRCKAGTWCYELGGMKLSSADGDWLYFFSLDYPFWHEVDGLGSIIDSFRIEVFRIKYTEHDVPLGLNNIPASRLSENNLADLESNGFNSGSSCNDILSIYTVNSSCKPIYYNAHELEYFGIRLQWQTNNWYIYADIISNQGNRNYYQYDDRHNLDRRKISGNAAEFEISWMKTGEKFTFLGMMAQGDEQLSDDSNTGLNYRRNLNGFFEISPGTYRGTQFYFNGGSPEINSGTGLGHSINNTQLSGFVYHYDIPETRVTYKFGIYNLMHIKPVIDSFGNKSSKIGVEWDNTFSMVFAEHAKIDLDFNAFKPDLAFSYSDHITPPAKRDTIYHLAGRITYSF